MADTTPYKLGEQPRKLEHQASGTATEETYGLVENQTGT
jgi:hypothetical protein